MDKTNWIYISALFSTAFGWFLNELGQWFRTKNEDKKIKKRILFNLLETNFIFNKLDNSAIVDLLSERILLRIPKQEQSNEAKQYLIQLYSGVIKEIAQDNVSNSLIEIENNYSKAVEDLATIDPITAYRLNGKTKILQTFDILENYYNKIKQQFPDDNEQVQNSFEIATQTIEPGIIKDAISDLELEIRAVAFSIDFKTWYEVRRTLKKSKDRVKKDGIKMIDELLDKLIPNF
ncbi:hypothetical protein SAMN05444274_1212 [Mariniphaga anaerophila]|uniref:Uncharacterized protein n=1 Tax=Mariniphaga anaerophila TaxID=1484053 RepID=A0A1M5GFP7_9BACT|nr:hypothetical protein [Mariniphaga anaerophila]SHG02544.1 hypothetical protein SAMN05444274_1212 [Mariniphaga anaerophila]